MPAKSNDALVNGIDALVSKLIHDVCRKWMPPLLLEAAVFESAPPNDAQPTQERSTSWIKMFGWCEEVILPFA